MAMDDDRLVKVLKALADARRFRMVQEIAAAGELSCGQLGERFALAQPTISHHVKILVDCGLLVVRQEAQHHFVSVNRPLIDGVVALLPSRLAPRAAGAARRKRVAAKQRG